MLNCKSQKISSSITFRSQNRYRIYATENGLWDDISSPRVNQTNISFPYIEFDLIHTHLRYPDREGDQLINEQVGGKFIDLIFQDPNEPNYINEGDMDYWFNEPDGGWRQGVARYYFLEEVMIQDVNWPKLARINDGTLRKPIDLYRLGDIVEGTCESIHLHHGICIDFGSNYLGILPMNATVWNEIYRDLAYEKYEEIRPDFDKLSAQKKLTTFVCQIRVKLDRKYFRWPVELDVLEPAWLAKYVIKIEDSNPKLLVVAKNLSTINASEYARASGRSFRPPRQYSCPTRRHAENLIWQQSQIDYYHEDHSQEFMFYEATPLTPMSNGQQIENDWCGSWRNASFV